MSKLVESSFPLDFRLIGRFGGQNDGQPSVLYSRVPVQSLDLEIYNTSRGTMTIQPSSAPFAPATDPHFYLTFRPGTLWDQDISLPNPTHFTGNDGWELKQDKTRIDNCSGYYLYRKSGTAPLQDLNPTNDPIIKVQIGNIQIDGSGGSRSTRVELKYENITTSGYDKALSGSRQQYLAIMDELPAQGHPPVAVQWVGTTTNQLLNDNNPQKLTLRLLNQSGHDLTLTATSKITLSFPQSTVDTPWGLIKGESDRQSVSIEGITDTMAGTATAWPPKATLGNYDTGKGVAVVPLSPQLIAPATKTLRNNDQINIPITITCSAPSGIAHLQVHYEGFGGLVDDVIVEVVKTPLIVAGGNVGIGTAAPEQALSVQGGMNIDQDDKNNGWSEQVLRFGKGSGEAIGSNRDKSDSKQFGGLDFYTQGHNRMCITQDGKVGIGTTAPQQPLSVQGAISIDQGNKGDASLSQGLLFGDNKNEGIGSNRTNSNEGHNKYGLDFYTASSNRMCITQDGKVGIGTTAPQAPLHVSGSASEELDDASRYLDKSRETSGGIFDFDKHHAQLGLHIQDNISAIFDAAVSTVRVWVVCDKHLKDHVGELSAETALAAIKGLRPVFFRRRPDWDRPAPANVILEAGFYAQELSESIPTATMRMEDPTSPDGAKWEVSHDQLHAYAAGAIQALAKQVEELKAEVALLKGKLSE